MIEFSDLMMRKTLGYLTKKNSNGHFIITWLLIVPYSTVSYANLRILPQAIYWDCKRLGPKNFPWGSSRSRTSQQLVLALFCTKSLLKNELFYRLALLYCKVVKHSHRTSSSTNRSTKRDSSSDVLKKMNSISDTTKILANEVRSMSKIFAENQKILI